MTHLDPDDPTPHDERRLQDLLDGVTDADFERVDPPADLFAGITSRLSAELAPPRVEGRSDAPVVISMDDGRRPRRVQLLAAAAAVLVVAAVGAVLATRDPAPSERQLASATLQQLEPLGSTRAKARLVEEGGRTHLIIDATDMAPPPAGSSYELWLVDPKITDPKSLGTITGTEDVVVPTSIDPSTYDVVDISLEPDDGVRAHSGHSLMRGSLA